MRCVSPHLAIIPVLFARCMLTFPANNDECGIALGMEDGSIKDEQITAKTWLYFERRDSRYYRPYFARLNYKKPSGGWCSTDLEDNPEQYVEVDLLYNTKVTGIATQGRYSGQEWVEHFKIEYKRYNETRYRRYLEKGQWKVFSGNTDTNTTVKQLFDRPLIVKNIRIIPLGNRFTIHCMRFELYGCAWKHSKDGLVEYSAPLGEVRKSISLQDDIYDGYMPYKATDYVFGGIGKLTDGQIATGSPAYNPNEAYTKWVGYKKKPIMIFIFNATKIFNSVSFYVLNQGKNFKLFEKVTIEISADGKKYKHVESYVPSKEAKAEQGVLQIKVPLDGNFGSFLRCTFDLNASWLLLTELEFNTESNEVTPTLPKRTVKAKKQQDINYLSHRTSKESNQKEE